ncbi:MAG: glutaredoxin-like protein NrdH [Alphaproteobacteria bacterium]
MTITLYTKPVCIQCVATKRELERRGMLFQEVDITQDHQAFDTVRGLGYMQVPVVMAEGKHWSGFRPDKIAALVSSQLEMVS